MHRLGFDFYMAELECKRERDAVISRMSYDADLANQGEVGDVHEHRGARTMGRTLFLVGIMTALTMSVVVISWAK